MSKRVHADGGECRRRPHAMVINLRRDTARLAAVAAGFARCGMAFERFEAVDGLAVPPAARPYFFDADGRAAPTLTRGEVGCYASHLTLWQRVARGQGSALVCEDDICVPENFALVLQATLAAAPEGWDVIRLSAPTRRTTWPVCGIGEGHRLVRYSKVPTLLGAYLVSPQGAGKLLNPGLRTRPVDLDMARLWELGLDLYGVDPAPVQQLTRNASSIDAVERRRYARRAAGVLGIPSRLFGRERFARTWHNARTVGLRRAAEAEFGNLFRRRPVAASGARAAQGIAGRHEPLEV